MILLVMDCRIEASAFYHPKNLMLTGCSEVKFSGGKNLSLFLISKSD